jgi:hypothetical protein
VSEKLRTAHPKSQFLHRIHGCALQFKEPGEAEYWLQLHSNRTVLSPATVREQDSSSSYSRLYRVPSTLTGDSLRRRSSSSSSSHTCALVPLNTTAAAVAAAAADVSDHHDVAHQDTMQFTAPDAAANDECLRSEQPECCVYDDYSIASAPLQHRQSLLEPLLERTATPFHLRWRERHNV